LLEGSEIRRSHADCNRVQDAYSLRCIPQVHGAVRDTLNTLPRVFETEVNSAVDNPLVFVKDSKTAEETCSLAATSTESHWLSPWIFLAIALTALAGISERRHRTTGESSPERRPSGIPSAGRRAKFRFHDAAGDSRCVSQREQSAGASRIGGLDYYLGNKEDYVSMGMNGGIEAETHRRKHTQRISN